MGRGSALATLQRVHETDIQPAVLTFLVISLVIITIITIFTTSKT